MGNRIKTSRGAWAKQARDSREEEDLKKKKTLEEQLLADEEVFDEGVRQADEFRAGMPSFEETITTPQEDIKPTVTPEETEKAKKDPESVVGSIRDNYDNPRVQKMWDTLEKEQRGETAKLDTAEAGKKRRVRITQMVKDLIDAAALLYAAKQGVEADLKLTGNSEEAERRLREVEREIDRKRQVLAKRMSTARALFGDQEARRERKEVREEAKQVREERDTARATERAESEAARTSAAEAKQKEAARKEELRARKEFDDDQQRREKDLTKKMPETSEEMQTKLEEDFPSIPPEKLRALSGVDEGWAWFDNEPAKDKINKLYKRKSEIDTINRYKKAGLPVPSHLRTK